MRKIAIIGGGPAGSVCAYYALKNLNNFVTIFDVKPIMSTILPTGNGRCNFSYAEFDFKELAKNYPRGEKFLYSVFSRFAVAETLVLFDELGIKYYMQEDLRFFPVSNSSKEVQKAFAEHLNKCKNFKYRKQKITNINALFNEFDAVVVATGGSLDVIKLIKNFNQPIIEFKPALTALIVENTSLYSLSGVSVENALIKLKKFNEKAQNLWGDILFTHNSISGPLIYKISSIMAFEKLPYCIHVNFSGYENKKEFENDFMSRVALNQNKNVLNVISKYVPRSLAELILKQCRISHDLKCNSLSKIGRNSIVSNLFDFELKITGVRPYGETVMAGGVDTDFVNAKNMQSKVNEKLFLIGEVLNVDGFCGGFNLQNCWSTGAICGQFFAQTEQ